MVTQMHRLIDHRLEVLGIGLLLMRLSMHFGQQDKPRSITHVILPMPLAP
jgi:hypothetical protein